MSKAPNILLLSTDLFHFSNIGRRHFWVWKLFRKPHWYLENIFSKHAFVQACIFQMSLINLEECSLVYSFLWYIYIYIFLTFLYKGLISACLRISGNVDNFMELLKILQRKLLKILLFSFKTFIGTSELCYALLTSSFKISFFLSRFKSRLFGLHGFFAFFRK